MEPFVRSIRVRRGEGYPITIPALAALEELALDPRVTFFAGENGSGKSTLAEAIALAAGFGPEGGSQNYGVSTRDSHSALHEAVTLVRGARRPRTGFFLRAESFFNVATTVDSFAGPERAAYGERSLHEQSHGESFLALVVNRFGPNGFYVLDEPEAALSVRGCLALIARMHDLVEDGSQFVVATHSPILLGFPGATIYRLDDDGIEAVPYDETDAVRLTREFLAAPERFLRYLLAD
jgi:predicted ATPase